MRQWCRHISFRRVTHFGRRLVTCALVPVLLVSSVTTQAILIHDHHGHEIHGHALTIHDLDEWRENSERHHEEHEHGDPPANPSDDEDQSIWIVLDLPVALPGVHGLSRGVVVTSTAPATTMLALDNTAASGRRSPYESGSSCAHVQRARSLVAGILLTSHALLL